MSPKEKAAELIEKFKPHADWNNEYGSAESGANEKHAKQCALIAVKELIQNSLGIETIVKRDIPADVLSREYLQQVKTEIEKL